ncbi:type VI secretion system Vgr family protein [Chondromyces apiculatus]|uniref:VgrG protein n=1 Tax=Chondromyces apiculatus DSM 436 TaxID=1192034 RepID=A0A017T7Z0_9BACT|nr:type VI secretion system tip protein TssI/VgrG [Chondromyces apiculatus]EYF04711.1 VgrG protein [Chondromyces apiculatus DSM 436]
MSSDAKSPGDLDASDEASLRDVLGAVPRPAAQVQPPGSQGSASAGDADPSRPFGLGGAGGGAQGDAGAGDADPSRLLGIAGPAGQAQGANAAGTEGAAPSRLPGLAEATGGARGASIPGGSGAARLSGLAGIAAAAGGAAAAGTVAAGLAAITGGGASSGSTAAGSAGSGATAAGGAGAGTGGGASSGGSGLAERVGGVLSGAGAGGGGGLGARIPDAGGDTASAATSAGGEGAQRLGAAEAGDLLASTTTRVGAIAGGKVAEVSGKVAKVGQAIATVARGPNLLELSELAASAGVVPREAVEAGKTVSELVGAVRGNPAGTVRDMATSALGSSPVARTAAGMADRVGGVLQQNIPGGGGLGGTLEDTGQPLLEVTVASGDTLDIRQFSVEEGLSSLFAIHLVVVSENADVPFDGVVGQPASFTFRSGAHTRSWTGLCNHLQQIRVEEEGLSTYELTIVPTLWLLTQRRNYRMFQQLSEPEIVQRILSEWAIEPQMKLTETYKGRKYRVQYAETDYDFISRMLEDAGITFLFEEVDGETKLTLTDSPQSREPRAEKIAYRDAAMTAPDREHVTSVRVGQRVRPGRYTMRDHDYRRPPSYRLMASAEATNSGIEARLERFHYTPGAFLFRADRGEDSPVADDRGRARTDEREGEALARKRLEAKRVRAKTCAFTTNAHDLGPGVVMSMLDHPKSDLGPDRPLLIVESSLMGTPNGDWGHQCEAVSAELPYRPPLAAVKPKVSGVESATVVGPSGEEIHCDEFGRVRVHFHWDRESQMNEGSSCWIHVSQPWGGAGYGGTSLPRIGQEVLVDFLGGDPDRPVIVGRLYTNLQKTPYALPANKTQSGWKSNSTTSTGGYNELMFEDAAGRELLRMQAERDLQKLVKNDETVTVGHDRTKLVRNDDELTVGRNRTKRVVANESVTVGINRVTAIGQNDLNAVGVKHELTIATESGGATTTTHTDGTIVLTTGKGATIVLQGAGILITADFIDVIANAGDVLIQGGPMVKINP